MTRYFLLCLTFVGCRSLAPVECGPGFHCDDRLAQCQPDTAITARDAGLSWMP